MHPTLKFQIRNYLFFNVRCMLVISMFKRFKRVKVKLNLYDIILVLLFSNNYFYI